MRGSAAGPAVLLVGGIHGNEPAGVEGIREVLEVLGRRGLGAGDVLGMVGNRSALARSSRFVDVDMNRIWGEEGASANGSGASEVGERRKLMEALGDWVQEASGPVYALDLHTTSGHGPPFQSSMRVPGVPHEWSAGLIPVPRILGVDALVQGTLVSFLASRWKVRSILFEGGQHEDPGSPRRIQAAVWALLGSLGVLPEGLEDRSVEARTLLEEESHGLPRLFQMVHRHPVLPGERFQMEPGYFNFQDVRRGELLARSRRGWVRAPQDGRILMPLYQETGSDGFFLVEPHDGRQVATEGAGQ